MKKNLMGPIWVGLLFLTGCGGGTSKSAATSPGTGTSSTGAGVTATGTSGTSTTTTTAPTKIDYIALGDSITYGYGLPGLIKDAYPTIVAASRNLISADVAISGDQACDLMPRQIYAGRIGTDVVGGIFTVLIGTNDVDRYGLGAYEQVFNTCDLAALAWVATQRADKLLTGDSDLTVTGSCTGQADDAYSGGIVCGASDGTISSAGFLTTGAPLYIWYGLDDTARASASFTVMVDGVQQASQTVHAAVPVATQNGTARSVGLLRIPVAAGTHRVKITTSTGYISVQGMGSVRTAPVSTVYVGDLPSQSTSRPAASVATQLGYSADIQSNIATLNADGLPVRFVPNRLIMQGTAAEMLDAVHPSPLGQQHLADAFLAAIP